MARLSGILKFCALIATALVTAFSGAMAEQGANVLKAGATMSDGTVYAGIGTESRSVGTTGPDGAVYAGVGSDSKPIFTTTQGPARAMTYGEAAEYCSTLDANGHRDWTLPTPSQIKEMIKNSDRGALKNTFNLTDQYPIGWYWTNSAHQVLHARKSRLSEKTPYITGEQNAMVRCVR